MKSVNVNTHQFDTGWIVVIIALVIFWPIGLFLLFNKLRSDRKAAIKCHKLLMIVSFVLMGLGVMHLFRALGSWGTFGAFSSYTLFLAIVTGGGGLYLYRIAKRTKITGEKYKQYIAIIINHGQSSIDNIASAMGVAYEMAVDDLQKMIVAGFFPGAYIDFTRRKILFKKPVSQGVEGSTVNAHGMPQAMVSNCQNCGANNTIDAGQLAECEYCGSPL